MEDSLSGSSEDDHFDGLEGTYNLQSTYFDVFDNLMRKYVGDLNTRDELQRKLTKELGKQSIFLYQRLNQIEEKAEMEYF